MRTFIVKASTVHTSPDFLPRSIAATSGRIDVVARALISAFRLRTSVRRDVEFVAVLEGPPSPPVSLRAVGKELIDLPESEVEICSILGMALRREPVRGFSYTKKSFKWWVSEFLSKKDTVVACLLEEGVPIEHLDLEKELQYVFLLGGHLGFDGDSIRFLEEKGVAKWSVGRQAYFTSHCIIAVNEELDRRKLDAGRF